MKIENGIYVRTIDGEIDIVIGLDMTIADSAAFYTKKGEGYLYSEIKSASHNLIDLVEVGDIVNGKVLNPWDLCEYENDYEDDYEKIKKLKIETIITKEQYNRYAFKVGGEN